MNNDSQAGHKGTTASCSLQQSKARRRDRMRAVGASLHPWGLTGCRDASERGGTTGRSVTPSPGPHWSSCHRINDTRQAFSEAIHRRTAVHFTAGTSGLRRSLRQTRAHGYRAVVMPMLPTAPSATGSAVDPVAVAVVDDALKLRASHPAAPTLDILDLVLRGRRSGLIDFGEVLPVNPFGLLAVEAFDRGMPVSDWIGSTGTLTFA